MVAERATPAGREDQDQDAAPDPDLPDAPRSADAAADGHDEGTEPAIACSSASARAPVTLEANRVIPGTIRPSH